MMHTRLSHIAWLMVILMASLLPGASPVSASTPIACNSGEIFMDSQAWWSNPDGGAGQDFGHLHTGLCWPHKATITQSMTIKVRSVMHKNPGSFYRLMVQVFDAKDPNAPSFCGDNYAIDCLTFSPARTLANCVSTGGQLNVDGDTCVWYDDLQINLDYIGYPGWQQFRFRGFVLEPDRKEMRTSTGLHADVQNGKQVKNVYEDPNVVEARGWYTKVGYANALIKNPPLGPVSGLWEPYVEMKKGEGPKLIGHYAALDTDFHHGNRGTPLKEGSGEFRGKLSIDTTTLENGWHRLFLRADQYDQRWTTSTNSGVLLFYFEVQNGTALTASASGN